ncbi:hypothetical protein EOPP23_00095 [Endozoicomonas sp. OPT23]|uniref:hypothetical protein n=1 Tax=Endozoicomonas sp. OPT23 TaxID=2072845 RepID=UPI00129A9FB7|nr:hypothetical protein [Endozoicomonas sp. OPT23]MRI31388.1 hypothetical protein [Endozoicomonas sp. OPT23]
MSITLLRCIFKIVNIRKLLFEQISASGITLCLIKKNIWWWSDETELFGAVIDAAVSMVVTADQKFEEGLREPFGVDAVDGAAI